MKKWLTVFSALIFLFIGTGFVSTAGAITYDLKTDWSDTNNPNGVWAFYQDVLLPLQSDYFNDGSNWEGYAKTYVYGTGHVPSWLQVDGSWSGADFQVGDIVFHPTSLTSSSPPNVESFVTWTSPIDGQISISGNIWYGEATMPRGVDWYLYLNDDPLAFGTVYNGDAYDRSNPMTFSGGGVLSVQVGDDVKFMGKTGSGYVFPWFVGVNLTIDTQPYQQTVPEPTTMILVGLGFIGLAGIRKKFKN